MTTGDLGTLKEVQTVDGKGLLEGDARFPVQALGLDLGVALDGDAQGLIVGKPDVEIVEGLLIGNGDLLADVDGLVLVGVGLGKLEGSERGVRLEIFEVHVSSEAIDCGLNGSVGGDGRVDFHEV